MKALLKILAVVVILGGLVLGYIYGVHKPIEEKVARIQAEIDQTRTKITSEQNKLARIQQMRKVIEEGMESGTAVAAFDAAKDELLYLSEVVGLANMYNLSFGSPSISDDGYVRRSVSFSFDTDTYQDARKTIDAILDSPYRTILVTYSLSAGGDSKEGLSGDSKAHINVSVNLTFIESNKLPQEEENTGNAA